MRLYCHYRNRWVHWDKQNVMGRDNNVPFVFTTFLKKSPIITKDIAAALRDMSVKNAAVYLGVTSIASVTRYRRALGIASEVRGNGRSYTADELKIVFSNTAGQAARILGRSESSVRQAKANYQLKGYGVGQNPAPPKPLPSMPKPILPPRKRSDPTKNYVFTT